MIIITPLIIITRSLFTSQLCNELELGGSQIRGIAPRSMRDVLSIFQFPEGQT